MGALYAIKFHAMQHPAMRIPPLRKLAARPGALPGRWVEEEVQKEEIGD
jgi:hypothetical protein